MTQLDPFEAYWAGLAGYQRMFRARAKGFRQTRGEADDQWQVNINGAIAEALVAKHTGKYWHAVNKDFKDLPDVGDLEVRHTKYPSGAMLLHPSDKDDRKYVLVAGLWPECQIVGWIWGKDGKAQRFWKADIARPCFWIPQNELESHESI